MQNSTRINSLLFLLSLTTSAVLSQGQASSQTPTSKTSAADDYSHEAVVIEQTSAKLVFEVTELSHARISLESGFNPTPAFNAMGS